MYSLSKKYVTKQNCRYEYYASL